MQLLQMEQCEDRGGRYLRQVSQNFTFTVKPFTMTSLVRRNLILGVLPLLQSIDGVLEPRNSSASGGALVFLGTIPGSLADVMKRKTRSCICGQMDRDCSVCTEASIGMFNFGVLLVMVSDIQD